MDSFLSMFNIKLLVHCTYMQDALSFFLAVIFAYFECHSDCFAQPRGYWLLSPRAQISPGVLEEPTGWRGACGHKPAPPTTHSFLSTRHEPFLPAPICQGIRQQQASLSLKQKKVIFVQGMVFGHTVLLLPLGTCCWCVWSLLTTFDWNGAPAAVSDQEDCWHQPTYPTSCLWPFLVLLSVWSKRLSVSLGWFSISTFVYTKHRNTTS